MEHKKILNLLSEASDSKFLTRKWNTGNVSSKANYNIANKIIYIIEVFKFNLCDYNNPYVLVRGNITVTAALETRLSFRNCATCITKIDGTTIDGAENLDLVMPIYTLIEYSWNYTERTGSLWFYSREQATDFTAVIANDNKFECCKYKDNLLENIVAPSTANRILTNATIGVPLKYLSTFWRSLKIPLINYKVELKLSWTKYCVLFAGGNDSPDNFIVTIKDTKLYDSVVNLSARGNQKVSKLLRKRFQRLVYWNEYKTRSNNKDIKNEFRHFLESNFVGVNGLFVLIYTTHGNNVKIFDARKYYLPKGIIKNYNMIINGKSFYDQAIDCDKERYEEIRKLPTGSGEDYTTGCLLDYDYIKNHYRLIGIYLSR